MTNHVNDGGPAFPLPIAGCTDGSVYNTLQQSAGEFGGMTLRDYFAAHIIQGMLANPLLFGSGGTFSGGNFAAAWDAADAMIRAREK